MKINLKTPIQSLSGTYINSIVDEKDFGVFQNNLKKLYNDIVSSNENSQTEKHLEKLLNNFLNEVYYKGQYYINSKSYKGLNECDLVIHNSKDFNSSVGVLLELKTPRNLKEMVSDKSFMKQSFYETILYYLWEKVYHKNNEIHNIIITNFYDWFIIDSKEFERLFNNKKLIKFFESWRVGSTDDNKTRQMYGFIENFLNENVNEITTTYFNLKECVDIIDLTDEVSMAAQVSIYKLLSPKHLLNIKSESDSNSLNKNFYNELLFIVGLEEIKEKGKILLIESQTQGSLLEITKNIIESEGLLDNIDNLSNYGENRIDQLFNISLELCITWVNRIIFLKLLENQLINYNNGNKDLAFIGSDKIDSFQNINQLFFEVLSERVTSRNKDIKNKLKKITNIDSIPYLNSSLFEPTILEKRTLRISNLDDESEISLYPKSVLKQYDSNIKTITTFKYLLKFLECYDFGSSSKKQLVSSKNKTIINSSVLGLIFEKINGYKDGSVFTPSFITTKMCEETFEKSVLKKFNDKYKWQCENYTDLHNHLDLKKINEYNQLIDSHKICDPSVGSGHYLVSMLNEIIRVKSLLGLLCNSENKRLRDIEISIENDELIIRYIEGDLFKYYVNDNGINKVIQDIQETIFKEKKTIIENCLYGVDINSNSVQICRLRLWIELLKSSYYTVESNYKELQTLPNIDINIKQGNSLVQKYNFEDNLSSLFKGKFKVKEYQGIVKQYKETNDKSIKATLKQYLDELKQEFKTSIPNKLQETLSREKSEHYTYKEKLENLSLLYNEKISSDEKLKLKDLENKYLKTMDKLEEIRSNVFYTDAFEWRFEFPELIDDKGGFTCFDIIIGNPPYVVISKDNPLSKLYKWNTDLYLMFFEISINKLLKEEGFLSFITPRFYMVNQNCREIRQTFVDETNTYALIETNPFEEVNTECVITYIEKTQPKSEFIPIYQESKKIFNKINDLEKPLIRKRDLYTFITFLTKEIDEVLDYIEQDTNTLISITDESLRGLEIGKKDLKSLTEGIECLIGEDTNRYKIDFKNSFVDPTHKDYKRLEKFFQKDNMVLLRRVSKDLISTIPDKHYSFNKNIYGISLKTSFSNYFVCGLLNSELLNFYYKYKFSTKKEDLFPEIQKYLYEQLPIKKVNKSNESHESKIIELVKKLLENPQDHSSIQKLDEEVYKLYNITDNQKNIIKDLIKTSVVSEIDIVDEN